MFIDLARRGLLIAYSIPLKLELFIAITSLQKNTNNKMTTWNKVRNRLYYTNDDYIRDVIAFHMQDNAWDIIHNYIYSQ